MTGENVRGGWRMDATSYSEPIRRFLVEQIKNRRDAIVLPHSASKGPRFNSDSAVLVRVESNYTEEEFMADPVLTVDAMLIDAAGSDWWYDHEKRYDDEPCEDESDDCDE